MKLTSSWSSEEQRRDDDEQDITQKRLAARGTRQLEMLATRLTETVNTTRTYDTVEAAIEELDTAKTHAVATISIEDLDTVETVSIVEESPLSEDAIEKIAIPVSLSYRSHIESLDTQEIHSFPIMSKTTAKPSAEQKDISPKYAILLIGLLCVVVFNAFNLGSSQFLGVHGWAYVLGGPISTDDHDLLKRIGKQFALTPGSTAQATHHLTPQQYIDIITHKMTLDQKLGQMMLVQFTGPSYSLDLSTMISQYDVGTALIFSANQNIESRSQLKDLIQQMQSNSTIPMAVAIDQEGGYVDRLAALDGPRPAESTIGATGDPSRATAAGLQDAQDLQYYGINLNLAPVVDVTNVYNPQLDHRTYGSTANLVTEMAAAYLQGLQKSGKVLGTLKHFPGLGDVGTDPHSGVPYLYRSRNDLEQIDWAPYRSLIQQGNVHAVMVTHEIVEAIDNSKPSSLSYKVVTGILRNELGFQGVIMTDSLTMEGIAAYYTEAQAAVLAIEAGSDLLMGATTPSDVASMVEGIKQAINDGQISQQRIDDSVRRLLMMKYDMGLLPLPTNS